jgi:bifunctional DNA-binding transcriptional regulator/antitoxin component of YhaV-PrlF toxin-antitoxin module
MQITADGQIAIPPEMQQQLGLQPGTEVNLEIVGSTLHLTRKDATDDWCSVIDHQVSSLKSAFGCLPKRVDPQEFQAQVRNEWHR